MCLCMHVCMYVCRSIAGQACSYHIVEPPSECDLDLSLHKSEA